MNLLPRAVVAILLLALVAGGAAAVVVLRAPAAGVAGDHALEVVGPEGALFAGVVRAEEATVLGALLATGLRVETIPYPGMGDYVVAIEDHRAEGAAGWIYEVRRDGAWRAGDRSAALYPLDPGDEVRWSWTGG